MVTVDEMKLLERVRRHTLNDSVGDSSDSDREDGADSELVGVTV